MKIHELTDEQCSRWLAEKLEPKPIVGWPHGAQALIEAEKKCKLWRYPVSGKPEWQPRDMVNDPAMTLMLMDHIRKNFYMGMRIDFTKDEVDVRIYHGRLRELSFASGTQIGRAVVEAAMLSLGWTE